MHVPLKHSVMYSPATAKTHIHRYLKHIYHPTHSLCGSPTYPYITHATTLLWGQSVLDDLDKVMAYFPLIFHAAKVRGFSSCLLTKLFPTSVSLSLFCFGLLIDLTDATQKCAACRAFQRIGGRFCLQMGCFIRIYAVNVWIRKCLSLWLSQSSGRFFF